jgi:hypothetical protein
MRKMAGLILPDEETLYGFPLYTHPDDSTIRCPCGASFTWEGLSDHLDPWVKEHTPHLKKKP